MTKKETFFIEYYCVSFNAAEAARKAGYSKSTARQMGYELLTKPYIKDAIQSKTQKSLEELGVTQDRVIKELVTVAFSDIGKVFNENWSVKSLGEIPLEDRKAIHAFSKSATVISVRMYDKLKALELLKSLMFNE